MRVTLPFVGAYAGAIVGFPLAGIITHYLGWQYIFYTSGKWI
jgi:MFS family permease